MKVAVLHHSARPPWSSMQLLNAFTRLGIHAEYIVWDYISVELGRGCAVRYHGRCPGYAAVIVRGLGRGLTVEQLMYRYTVLKLLEDQDGVLVVNPVDPMFIARNKLLSLALLSRCGLRVPETMATESLGTAIRYVRAYGKAVVKPIAGSLGLGSFLVDPDTAYHVFNLLAKLKQPLYVQRYIEKKMNSDIRVFVVNGRPVAAARRRSRGTWKTNVAQGAETEPVSTDTVYAEEAVKATECLGLLYSGVDVAEDEDGRTYILEVNASPLWRGLLRATRVDPAPIIARMVLEKLRGSTE